MSYSATFGRVYCRVSSRAQWESIAEFRWRRCALCWFIMTPFIHLLQLVSHSATCSHPPSLSASTSTRQSPPRFFLHLVLRRNVKCLVFNICVCIIIDWGFCCDCIIWTICCDSSSSKLLPSWVLLWLQSVSLHLPLCLFLLCRVSGTSCDWTVGGCQESQPQQRWAGLSQGSAYIPWDILLDLHFLSFVWLSETF